MEMNDFIENFAAQFDDTELDEFKADTKIKELEEWSSLNVTLKGDDVKGVETIEDLYNLVKNRL